MGKRGRINGVGRCCVRGGYGYGLWVWVLQGVCMDGCVLLWKCHFLRQSSGEREKEREKEGERERGKGR